MGGVGCVLGVVDRVSGVRCPVSCVVFCESWIRCQVSCVVCCELFVVNRGWQVLGAGCRVLCCVSCVVVHMLWVVLRVLRRV